MTRCVVLYKRAMEQARVLAASRRMYIDGKWVEASNGATYGIPNPATEESIGTAPDATVDDMKRAIAAARRAFDDGLQCPADLPGDTHRIAEELTS